MTNVVSLSHEWRSNPFWPMDAQNPLAKSVLRCTVCGALKIIGHPMPVRCSPKLEGAGSGFSDESAALREQIAKANFYLQAVKK